MRIAEPEPTPKPDAIIRGIHSISATARKDSHTMSAAPAFYSINEIKKPLDNRVHNNNACPPGRNIPPTSGDPAQAGTGYARNEIG